MGWRSIQFTLEKTRTSGANIPGDWRMPGHPGPKAFPSQTLLHSPARSLRPHHLTGVVHQRIDGFLHAFLQVPLQEGHIQTLSDRPQHGAGFRVAEGEFEVGSE